MSITCQSNVSLPSTLTACPQGELLLATCSLFISYHVGFLLSLSLLVPGQTLETFVGADINTIVMTNLLSGMDYNVKIFASQASGFSDALTGLVQTRKPD